MGACVTDKNVLIFMFKCRCWAKSNEMLYKLCCGHLSQPTCIYDVNKFLFLEYLLSLEDSCVKLKFNTIGSSTKQSIPPPMYAFITCCMSRDSLLVFSLKRNKKAFALQEHLLYSNGLCVQTDEDGAAIAFKAEKLCEYTKIMWLYWILRARPCNATIEVWEWCRYNRHELQTLTTMFFIIDYFLFYF